jgi:Flp pilus assembly protein TadB
MFLTVILSRSTLNLPVRALRFAFAFWFCPSICQEYQSSILFVIIILQVKIAVVSSAKEPAQQSQEMKEKVEDDRKHQIEAAIVRIMKARQVLDHNQLMAQVTTQLHNRFAFKRLFALGLTIICVCVYVAICIAGGVCEIEWV